jgi:phosphotransferase system  glucose/maltose/N-acetylglucosamine-specific IIC component
MRVVSGLLKGGLIGFCVGALSWRIGMTGLPGFVDYGLIGALVGILGGRPPWRQETIWTPLLKGIFGVVVGVGLYWIAH